MYLNDSNIQSEQGEISHQNYISAIKIHFALQFAEHLSFVIIFCTFPSIQNLSNEIEVIMCRISLIMIIVIILQLCCIKDTHQQIAEKIQQACISIICIEYLVVLMSYKEPFHLAFAGLLYTICMSGGYYFVQFYCCKQKVQQYEPKFFRICWIILNIINFVHFIWKKSIILWLFYINLVWPAYILAITVKLILQDEEFCKEKMNPSSLISTQLFFLFVSNFTSTIYLCTLDI